MTNNKLTDPASFLNFIKPYVSPSGLISFNGIARCINLKPHELMRAKTLDFTDLHLSHTLKNLDYHHKDLYRSGFNFEAFLIVIDYYASFDNVSAKVLRATLNRFDAESELLKFAEIVTEKSDYHSSVYLSYINEIRQEKPGFLHNIVLPIETPHFKRKDGKDGEKRTNHLASGEELFLTLQPHLLLPANISLNGIAELLQVRPQAIASKMREELVSKRLREKLRFFEFDQRTVIRDGFPFVAFLLVLEHFAATGNKAATVAITTLESFDCELRIFYKLRCDRRGELKFLQNRYFKGYRKIDNEKLPESCRTSIVYRYQKQLESYTYHSAKPERLTDSQRLKYCSPETAPPSVVAGIEPGS